MTTRLLLHSRQAKLPPGFPRKLFRKQNTAQKPKHVYTRISIHTEARAPLIVMFWLPGYFEEVYLPRFGGWRRGIRVPSGPCLRLHTPEYYYQFGGLRPGGIRAPRWGICYSARKCWKKCMCGPQGAKMVLGCWESKDTVAVAKTSDSW